MLFEGDTDDVVWVTSTLGDQHDGRLTFAADCEDGVTMRFAGGTEFPSMMALGMANDLSATYSVARSIAREMRSIGLTWNFAPVADVNSNPRNPIINIRSFGSDPQIVADHAHAYARGMQDGGVIACAKHFPGHGDTSVDSHIDLPTIDRDRRSIDTLELVPFREAVRQGVRSIMVAHLAVPALDESSDPASMSEPIVSGLLRTEMGFDGLVVTDALDMHAISHRFTAREAAQRAYKAGCDVLCLPSGVDDALKGLLELEATKKVGKRRINKSFERLRGAHEWALSHTDVPVDLATAVRGHDVVALEAARRAITIAGRLRPLKQPLFVLALADDHAGTKPDEWLALFRSWCAVDAHCAVVPPAISDDERAVVQRGLETAGTVLAVVFVRPRGFSGTIGLSEDQQALAHAGLRRSSALLTFGSPYVLADVRPSVRIDCYSACTAALTASIEALARSVK